MKKIVKPVAKEVKEVKQEKIGICKIKPAPHRIIIEERLAEMKVKSIVMPNSIKNDSQLKITEGKIIRMGHNAFDYEPEDERTKVGDIVYFIKYDGIGQTYKEKPYRILMDESVWGTSTKYIQLDEELIDESR